MNVPGFLGNRKIEKDRRLAEVNKIVDENERATAKEALLEEIAEEDEAFKEGKLPSLMAKRAENAKRKAAARAAAAIKEVEPEVLIAEAEKFKPSHIHETHKVEHTQGMGREQDTESRERVLGIKLASLNKQMRAAIDNAQFDKVKELQARINVLHDREQEAKAEVHRLRMAELDEEVRKIDEENARRAGKPIPPDTSERAKPPKKPTVVPSKKPPKKPRAPRAKKATPQPNIPDVRPDDIPPVTKVAPGRKNARNPANAPAPNRKVSPDKARAAAASTPTRKVTRVRPGPRAVPESVKSVLKETKLPSIPKAPSIPKTPSGKYNRSDISKRAHIIKAQQKIAWGAALKAAWAEARK